MLGPWSAQQTTSEREQQGPLSRPGHSGWTGFAERTRATRARRGPQANPGKIYYRARVAKHPDAPPAPPERMHAGARSLPADHDEVPAARNGAEGDGIDGRLTAFTRAAPGPPPERHAAAGRPPPGRHAVHPPSRRRRWRQDARGRGGRRAATPRRRDRAAQARGRRVLRQRGQLVSRRRGANPCTLRSPLPAALPPCLARRPAAGMTRHVRAPAGATS